MKKTILSFFGLSLTTISALGQSPVYDSLNVNNINARFYSAGMMFLDTVNYSTGFEYIQGSGQSTIYAGNLWIGGKDANGQLHIAGQTFGQGKDFYPGPVSDPQHYPQVHNDWNYVWKVTKEEIDDYTNWFNCGQTLGCVQDPGYIIPNSILSWPANGDVNLGQELIIAPFFDLNGDGEYDPYNGDRPCIKGDMALFAVFNDDYHHGETGGDSLRVEIRVMHYAYDGPDSALVNTIFSEYTILNKSSITYSDMYIGVWEDMDIGCSEDDYIGCDVERNLGYSFNGDAIDDAGCMGAIGFGAYPPAQGLMLLKGPKQDIDGIANQIGIGANESINGCGYGDTIVDNERLGMGRFVYFDRILPSNIYGDPSFAIDYYNYMSGVWRDGTPFTYGGTGHGGVQLADYCYPGLSDTNYYSGTNGVVVPEWSELSEANPQGDRRMLMSVGPFNMAPSTAVDRQEFTLAHVTARDYNGNGVANSLELLKSYSDEIRNFYACDSLGLYQTCYNQIELLGSEEYNLTMDFEVHPNPSNGEINLSLVSGKIKKIEIHNLAGQMIFSKEILNQEAKINITHLPKGMYLITAMNQENQSLTKRIIKE